MLLAYNPITNLHDDIVCPTMKLSKTFRPVANEAESTKMQVKFIGGHMEKRLLDVETFADVMGIKRTLAWQLISRGEIESIKIGKRRLIPSEAIDQFIQTQRDRQSQERRSPGL
jgi:excisionase family DNA binding protein